MFANRSMRFSEGKGGKTRGMAFSWMSAAIASSLARRARAWARTHPAMTIPTRTEARTRAMPLRNAEVPTRTRRSTIAVRRGITT